MALTRPRAAQIYDIDYKQATRVVTVTNITLSGGAPNAVDGVNLSANDRVLVTGQSTASQNGIYFVSTLGSGSNGTWARSTDTNATGELLSGTIVMVTEGLIYADTQWKLTTDNPITIGSTALTFVQNYSANSISGGTSNVVVSSNANVTISSAGTANVLTVSSTGTVTSGTASVTGNITGSNVITAGNVSATGNISANYLLANIYYATGFSASRIFNGTSEANIGTSGGNANISIGGTSNVVVFATTGEYVTGVVSASGNITGGNLLTSGLSSVTGNITGGNLLTGGQVSATGNITGSYFIGNGRQLTGINSFGTIQVTGQSNIVANSINTAVTFAAGSGLALTTDASNNVLTISSVSTSSIFATGGSMGTITAAVTSSENLGLVTDAVTISYDLGSIIDASGLVYPSQLVLPTYTPGTLPAANPAAQFVYLSTSSIGPMTAFSDGTNWRFTSSGNIVS